MTEITPDQLRAWLALCSDDIPWSLEAESVALEYFPALAAYALAQQAALEQAQAEKEKIQDRWQKLYNECGRINTQLQTIIDGLSEISWYIEPHYRGATGRWMTPKHILEYIQNMQKESNDDEGELDRAGAANERLRSALLMMAKVCVAHVKYGNYWRCRLCEATTEGTDVPFEDMQHAPDCALAAPQPASDVSLDAFQAEVNARLRSALIQWRIYADAIGMINDRNIPRDEIPTKDQVERIRALAVNLSRAALDSAPSPQPAPVSESEDEFDDKFRQGPDPEHGEENYPDELHPLWRSE